MGDGKSSLNQLSDRSFMKYQKVNFIFNLTPFQSIEWFTIQLSVKPFFTYKTFTFTALSIYIVIEYKDLLSHFSLINLYKKLTFLVFPHWTTQPTALQKRKINKSKYCSKDSLLLGQYKYVDSQSSIFLIRVTNLKPNFPLYFEIHLFYKRKFWNFFL